eukprot:GSMAST32.ASY1.ANO1.2264.1 assembled CDS
MLFRLCVSVSFCFAFFFVFPLCRLCLSKVSMIFQSCIILIFIQCYNISNSTDFSRNISNKKITYLKKTQNTMEPGAATVSSVTERGPEEFVSESKDLTSSDIANNELSKPRDPIEAPLRKLTINLIHTYKRINEREYNNGYDDDEYNYKVRENEIFNENYIIDKRIGKGSFGQVVRAFDRRKKTHVAIKIIKSRKPFTKQAQTEINLLEYLNSKDPHDKCYNLYDLLRNTSFNGVSLNLIRKFGLQLLQALAFLSLPEINVVHCDLKPENILLRHPRRSAIKVIDFGSSCYGEKRMYKYIQSRFYRSPEVILGLDYSVGIDMWSLGCILVEMHTGEPLFNGSDEGDQMRRIVKLRGIPPNQMLEESPKVKQFFDKRMSRRKHEILKTKKMIQVKKNQKIKRLLILLMLCQNPKERITPVKALQHPFFNRVPNQSKVAVHRDGATQSISSGTQTSEREDKMSNKTEENIKTGASSSSASIGNSCLSNKVSKTISCTKGPTDVISTNKTVDQCTQTPRQNDGYDEKNTNMEVDETFKDNTKFTNLRSNDRVSRDSRSSHGTAAKDAKRGASVPQRSKSLRSSQGTRQKNKKEKDKSRSKSAAVVISPANPNAAEGKDRNK